MLGHLFFFLFHRPKSILSLSQMSSSELDEISRRMDEIVAQAAVQGVLDEQFTQLRELEVRGENWREVREGRGEEETAREGLGERSIERASEKRGSERATKAPHEIHKKKTRPRTVTPGRVQPGLRLRGRDALLLRLDREARQAEPGAVPGLRSRGPARGLGPCGRRGGAPVQGRLGVVRRRGRRGRVRRGARRGRRGGLRRGVRPASEPGTARVRGAEGRDGRVPGAGPEEEGAAAWRGRGRRRRRVD